MIMCVHSAMDFLAMSILIKSPVVTNMRRVSLEAFSLSKPTLYPTSPPSLQPLSSATLLAKAWAANFRGWKCIKIAILMSQLKFPSYQKITCVTMMFTYLSWVAKWSNKNWGTWVLLPQPVTPEMTVTQCASILAKSSWAHLKTGKDRSATSASRSIQNFPLEQKDSVKKLDQYFRTSLFT